MNSYAMSNQLVFRSFIRYKSLASVIVQVHDGVSIL